MIWVGALWLLAIGVGVAAVLLAMALARTGARVARFRTGGARLEPLLLAGDRADWSQAPVHGAPLLIRYREASGEETEGVVHPKSIMGAKVGDRGVRPDTINAFCETRQTMRTLRYGDIVWAADARTGEFIDDLHGYFAGAQPGGAPTPRYGKADAALPAKPWKRHW